MTGRRLGMYDHLPADQAVRLAWREAGVNPQHHQLMQRSVRSQMPLLARALDRLAKEKQ